MKSRKIVIIGFCGLAVLALTIVLILNSISNKEQNPENKEGYTEIYLDWENLCTISISGMDGDAYAYIDCDNIPELENRKENEEAIFKENLPKYIDEYTDEEKESAYKRLLAILAINETNLCSLNINENLKNGDEIIVTCGNEYLKDLGYKYDNSFTYKVSDLEKSEIIQNDEFESLVAEEEPIDLTTDAYIYTLSDDSLWIKPTSIEDYILEKEYQNQGYKILIINTEEDLYIAKEKALESNIDFIILDDKSYPRYSNFEEAEPYKGVGG